MDIARNIIVAENITANGVIEFIDPWFDPREQDDEELLDVMRDHIRDETDLVLGRTTFEEFRSFWPHQAEDTTGFTRHLNTVRKHVVSSTMRDPAWANSSVLAAPLEDGILALKRAPGGDIGITGSISVVHSLMRADLVDEYRLFVYPVLTARGRNLVPDGLSMHGLSLAEARSFPSRVTLLRYLRAR